MTPADISAQQFRIALRGYAVEEVDAFLETVETELSLLLSPPASRASAVLESAARVAEQLVAEARAQAEDLQAWARAELSRQEVELERLRRREVDLLETRRRHLEAEVSRLAEQERGFRERLLALLHEEIQRVGQDAIDAPVSAAG